MLTTHIDRYPILAWPIYEQLFIAALDTENWELSDVIDHFDSPDRIRGNPDTHCLSFFFFFFLFKTCLCALQKQYPKSRRVDRLTGMLCEAQGLYEQAIQCYDGVLKSDETNLVIVSIYIFVSANLQCLRAQPV